MEYNNPENFERSAKLAQEMYQHIAKSGFEGLPFADVAAAIAMVNGMFLCGAYKHRPQRETAARNMAKAAVEQARRLEGLPRTPWGAPATGST